MRTLLAASLIAFCPLTAGSIENLDLAVQSIIVDLTEELYELEDSSMSHYNTIVPYYTLCGKIEAYTEMHTFLSTIATFEKELDKVLDVVIVDGVEA